MLEEILTITFYQKDIKLEVETSPCMVQNCIQFYSKSVFKSKMQFIHTDNR